MARRTAAPPPRSTLRADLAEKLRVQARDYAERLFDRPEDVEHYTRAAADTHRAAALDRGEAVEVNAHELRDFFVMLPYSRRYLLTERDELMPIASRSAS